MLYYFSKLYTHLAKSLDISIYWKNIICWEISFTFMRFLYIKVCWYTLCYIGKLYMYLEATFMLKVYCTIFGVLPVFGKYFNIHLQAPYTLKIHWEICYMLEVCTPVYSNFPNVYAAYQYRSVYLQYIGIFQGHIYLCILCYIGKLYI